MPYFDVRWEKGAACGDPTCDVITSPVGTRKKAAEQRPAVYGEPIAVRLWNPGQVSESCARFAIVWIHDGQEYQTPATDDSYDAIFDRHNSLFREDGSFIDVAEVSVFGPPRNKWRS